MASIGCILFNYEHGGLQTDGHYEFEPLQRTLADCPRRGDLVFLCEAKSYGDKGKTGLLLAAKAISEVFDAPYVGLLGWLDRGPIPPAIFYNPQALTHLPPWYGAGSYDAYADQRNVAHFAVRAANDTDFLAGVDHWEPLSGSGRLRSAQRWGRYGYKQPKPVIFAADCNATASGPHLPQRDWQQAATHDWVNCSHKGREVNGVWEPDTDAMDHLLGRWDTTQCRRIGGAGFTAIAELAWEAGMQVSGVPRLGLDAGNGIIVPTVNDQVDIGGGLHIDWALVNEPMLRHVVPSTYQVHLPGPDGPASDHRMVTWELAF